MKILILGLSFLLLAGCGEKPEARFKKGDEIYHKIFKVAGIVEHIKCYRSVDECTYWVRFKTAIGHVTIIREKDLEKINE